MELRKITAGVATVGLLGLGGLGFGAGSALADPPSRPDKPGKSDSPGNSANAPGRSGSSPGKSGTAGGNSGNAMGNSGNAGPSDRPASVTGPGVNAGAPGNPLPPGLGYLPPPGHGGPMPEDRIELPETPSWVTTPVEPPEDAPSAPDTPAWAAGLPVVWNPDLGTWGVWNDETGDFIRL